MQQAQRLLLVSVVVRSKRASRMWLLWLPLFFCILTAHSSPMAAGSENSEDTELLQLAPVDNSSSALPARGYQSRPCGFDLNHNGVIGEAADCNVCDASQVSGKIVANTVDPDGDGIEEDLIYVDCDDGSNFNYCGRPGFGLAAPSNTPGTTIANGPRGGVEDIVCFTGTCTPDAFRFPEAFNGVPGYWTKPKTGSRLEIGNFRRTQPCWSAGIR